jgi:hypothetical protein
MKTIQTNQANRRSRTTPFAVVVAASEQLYGSSENQPSGHEQAALRAAQNKTGGSMNEEPTGSEAPTPDNPTSDENSTDTASDTTKAGSIDEPPTLPR